MEQKFPFILLGIILMIIIGIIFCVQPFIRKKYLERIEQQRRQEWIVMRTGQRENVQVRKV